MSDASGAGEPTRTRLGLPFGLQLSLFELLAILLFAGVGAAALREGGTTASILVQAALWLFIGIALIALLAQGSWQGFAIGFVLGVAGYAIPPLYVGQSELDPYEGRLPLTKAMFPVWKAVEGNVYRDPTTGEEFEASEVTLMQNNALGGGGMGGGMIVAPNWPASSYASLYFQTSDGRTVEQFENPPRQEFMLAAHSLLAIAIGYVFGKIATVIYRRRTIAPQLTDI